VLIDIDGMLTVSWQPLSGAVAALARLRADRYPVALVTNTTSRSSIAGALAGAGFPSPPGTSSPPRSLRPPTCATTTRGAMPAAQQRRHHRRPGRADGRLRQRVGAENHVIRI
jgi:hypothetical protein